MKNELAMIPFQAWILIAVILTSQGLWMFNDARKRGMNKWLWGFFGLLNCPSNLIVYLIVSRIVMKSVTCHSCGKKISYKHKYCPHCGVDQDSFDDNEGQ